MFRDKVRGNGTIKTETRTAGDFTRVDVHDHFDVYIRQDSARSVRIEADENLLEYIDVHNSGSTLIIEARDGYNLKGSRAMKVYVSSPAFEAVEASGACSIFSENRISAPGGFSIDLSGASDAELELNAPKVNADLSGAGSIKLKGETKDFYVDGSGSSSIKCMDLMAENVTVGISGAGNAEVYASVKLDVKVSGAGHVKYKGNASVNQRISGAGSVTKQD